jgi:hypothetical protein
VTDSHGRKAKTWIVLTGGRAGFALAATLFALIIIGAIVAASFALGMLEQYGGRVALSSEQAREAAEWGIAETAANLPAASLSAIPIGAPALDLGTIQLAEGLQASRTVSRLTSTLFLFRSQGTQHDRTGRPLASRWVASLVRLNPSGSAVQTERGWIQLF